MVLAFKTIISKFYLFPLRCFSYLASSIYALSHKRVNIESYQFFLNDEGRYKSARISGEKNVHETYSSRFEQTYTLLWHK